MAQLIKPTEISVKTVNGEVLVNLKLDININLTQGVVNTTVESKQEEKKVKQEEKQTLWEIPEFNSVPKIKFGNKEQSWVSDLMSVRFLWFAPKEIRRKLNY